MVTVVYDLDHKSKRAPKQMVLETVMTITHVMTVNSISDMSRDM